MANKKRNWLLIVLGVVAFVVILVVGAAVGFGYYMYRQLEPSKITTGNPEQQFDEVRARFKGQTPFIDLSTENEDVTGAVHHEQETTNAAPINKLRLVAYDPDEKALVKVSLPMWILRWARNKPIQFRAGGGRGIEWDNDLKLKVTPAEIERHGPGLIVDTVTRKGERVIVWAE